MARKRRGGRRGMRVGKYVNLGFKVLGLVVAASPAIRAAKDSAGDWSRFPALTSLYYIGFNPNDPNSGVSTPNLTAGVASLIGGLAIAKIGGFLAKRF